jgi:hypothetical protein
MCVSTSVSHLTLSCTHLSSPISFLPHFNIHRNFKPGAAFLSASLQVRHCDIPTATAAVLKFRHAIYLPFCSDLLLIVAEHIAMSSLSFITKFNSLEQMMWDSCCLAFSPAPLLSRVCCSAHTTLPPLPLLIYHSVHDLFKSIESHTTLLYRLHKRRHSHCAVVSVAASTVALCAFDQCFSRFFFRGGTCNIIVHIPRNPCLWGVGGEIINRRLLTHGDYSNISNCLTKILAIFRGTFIIVAVFQNSYEFTAFHYSSRGP